ncbi:GntR family transcriptional regulator [Agromyces humatus]|uniref:GntR family transcriptional regulator n=1 Tax=Agromyces humatus TaxID=279573 RepID=A0ABN2K9U5_9MICO|nr:GntR family transcriptional regulator [Agromyces humatus]
MAIERKNLRSQVRDELLARMRTGLVQPGEGINEVQLAAELGVSRTPLREALIALESEGQISSENGKGFRFVPLSAQEFEDLAPVLAALEGLAIELSPLDELRPIGVRLAALAAEFDQEVAQHALVVTKDDEWHAIMLSACPNQRLLDVIASVRGAFHRYESLLVPNDVMIGRVAAEHAAIAERLAAGDVPGATVALKANWMNGMRRIVDNASSAYFSA